MGAQKAAEADKAELQSKMSLEDLKTKLQDDDEQIDSDQQEQETFGTKTLKEQEEAKVETAQDEPDADTLIEREQDTPEISDQETTSEPG